MTNALRLDWAAASDPGRVRANNQDAAVAELEREGRLTAEEARVHPQRNIVTRVLGNAPDVDVDEFPIDPFRGDRFLLCSDGLFNEVRDDEIAAVLRAEHEPQRAVDELV